LKLEGWLLDVQLRENLAELWIRGDGGRVKLRERYRPEFYVEPLAVPAEVLLDMLEEHPNIAGINIETRAAFIGQARKVRVLRIKVDRVENYRRLLREVDKMPHIADVYDSDISHELKYMADRGLTPMGAVRVEVDSMEYVRSIKPVPRGREVEPPPLRPLIWGMKMEGMDATVHLFDDRLREEYRFTGPIRRTLTDFLDHWADVDPDMVVCRGKDLYDLLNLARDLDLRRFGSVSRDGLELYGGRIHVETSTYGRLSLSGIVERVQYTRLPARVSVEWAAGIAIEMRQCYEARRRGILLRRLGGFQPVMTLRDLFTRDMGGIIFTPDVGLHENVAALDFESMYPNLIVRRNISYENIRSDTGEEGFLVDFTREALDRRLYFKHLRYMYPAESDQYFWCNGRQNALKEILFCTYGYSGCWANRFGNYDTFAEINSEARDTLVDSMNIAREQGYRTIYGNNDSLFLARKNATRGDYESLAARIADRVGLPMALENHFKYLVLLPQKGEPNTGAANHYYGVTHEGKHVFRGIELRRRDTAPYVAEAQRRTVEALLGWETRKEVLTEGIQRAQTVMEEACNRLRRGEVPEEELRMKTYLRRNPQDYKARLPHVAAAEALSLTGKHVERGTLIDYVYVDAGHSNPFRRVRPGRYRGPADVDKYVALVREAGRSVLMPFKMELDDARATARTSRLEEFFIQGGR
jgi:DNA polymerase elongation subunit (family B)